MVWFGEFIEIPRLAARQPSLYKVDLYHSSCFDAVVMVKCIYYLLTLLVPCLYTELHKLYKLLRLLSQQLSPSITLIRPPDSNRTI